VKCEINHTNISRIKAAPYSSEESKE